jgi:hypothetical protein
MGDRLILAGNKRNEVGGDKGLLHACAVRLDVGPILIAPSDKVSMLCPCGLMLTHLQTSK